MTNPKILNTGNDCRHEQILGWFCIYQGAKISMWYDMPFIWYAYLGWLNIYSTIHPLAQKQFQIEIRFLSNDKAGAMIWVAG